MKQISIRNLTDGGILSTLVVTLLLLLTSHPPNAQGTMRGPHHPRNSPRVAPEAVAGHQHKHYVPKSKGSPGEPAQILTHDTKLLHDKEHIKEDLGEWVATENMSPEEMEFHYFKMHDFDNNSMLDGLEILQAISHILPQDDEKDNVDLTYNAGAPKNSPQNIKLTADEQRKQSEEDIKYYAELIDRVLEEDDMNKDGYLSYFEYVVGRRREEKKEKALHSSNPS